MLLVILMCLGCALLSGEAMAASPGTVRFYQNSGVREFVVLRRKAAKNTNITSVSLIPPQKWNRLSLPTN